MKGLLLALLIPGTILPLPVEIEPRAEPEPLPSVVIPRKTPVHLELLENLNSKLSRTGELVRFLVADDVVVDGQVILAEGAPIQGRIKFAQPSKSNGRAGVLQVVAPKVRVADGSEIRMFGEIVSTGRQRSGAAAHAAIWGGAGFLAMKGRQAYHFRGEIFEILTRAEESISIPPEQREAETEEPPRPESAVAVAAPITLTYNPNKGNLPPEVWLVFPDHDGSGAPHSAKIVQVDGMLLPRPVLSRRVRAKGASWEAEFEPWPLIRHLAGSGTGQENRVYLDAVFGGGEPVPVEARVVLQLKEKKK